MIGYINIFEINGVHFTGGPYRSKSRADEFAGENRVDCLVIEYNPDNKGNNNAGDSGRSRSIFFDDITIM